MSLVSMVKDCNLALLLLGLDALTLRDLAAVAGVCVATRAALGRAEMRALWERKREAALWNILVPFARMPAQYRCKIEEYFEEDTRMVDSLWVAFFDLFVAGELVNPDGQVLGPFCELMVEEGKKGCECSKCGARGWVFIEDRCWRCILRTPLLIARYVAGQKLDTSHWRISVGIADMYEESRLVASYWESHSSNGGPEMRIKIVE